MFYVVSILKDKNNKTVGAKIFDGIKNTKVQTEILKEYYNKYGSNMFSNAILTKEGYVRSKNGSTLLVETVNTSSNTIRLYHGSHNGLKGSIQYNKSRSGCDFGLGFYAGDLLEQARMLICEDLKGKLYYLDVDLSKLNVYYFNNYIEWTLYIGINRGMISIKEYPKLKDLVKEINSNDVIVGLIADDRMYRMYSEFIEGTTSDKVLYECLRSVKLGNQYVFKNQKACNCIQIGNSIKLSNEDR